MFKDWKKLNLDEVWFLSKMFGVLWNSFLLIVGVKGIFIIELNFKFRNNWLDVLIRFIVFIDCKYLIKFCLFMILFWE